jgi:Mce-associated membrane protein
VLVGLAVLAVGAAAWFGWTWWRASQEDSLRLATTRDEVLDNGRRLLVDLNTMDYRSAAAWLDRWRQAAAGTLLEQLDRDHDAALREVLAQQTVASATVIGAAVTEVDVHGGSAELIAAVEVRLNRQGAQASVTRSRLTTGLTRTGQGWRISSWQPVGQGGGS